MLKGIADIFVGLARFKYLEPKGEPLDTGRRVTGLQLGEEPKETRLVCTVTDCRTGDGWTATGKWEAEAKWPKGLTGKEKTAEEIETDLQRILWAAEQGLQWEYTYDITDDKTKLCHCKWETEECPAAIDLYVEYKVYLIDMEEKRWFGIATGQSEKQAFYEPVGCTCQTRPNPKECEKQESR